MILALVVEKKIQLNQLDLATEHSRRNREKWRPPFPPASASAGNRRDSHTQEMSA
jgi:hypothetical protein